MSYNVDKNQLHIIAMTSMVLGSVAGTGLILVTTEYSRLGLYLLFIAAYHLLEFINTYTYQRETVTESLFLLYGNVGSKEYLLMQFHQKSMAYLALYETYHFYRNGYGNNWSLYSTPSYESVWKWVLPLYSNHFQTNT